MQSKNEIDFRSQCFQEIACHLTVSRFFFFFPSNMQYCKYTWLLSTNSPVTELFIFSIKWSHHFFLQVFQTPRVLVVPTKMNQLPISLPMKHLASGCLIPTVGFRCLWKKLDSLQCVKRVSTGSRTMVLSSSSKQSRKLLRNKYQEP